MLKKIITYTLIAVLFLSTTVSFAASATAKTITAEVTPAETTTKTQSTWADSLANLKLMGVVNESDLNITSKMTREVFSKIIVNSTGNYELAQALSGSTTFSDVSKTSALCGYINAAVNKGYLSAMSDGKFRPKNAINFAQLCTAMVKALGYTSSDIIGSWPNGYIEKAKSLGLTTGFSLKSSDTVLTSAVITMIDKMLNTNIKKSTAEEADKELKDSAGIVDDETNYVYGKPEVAYNFDPNFKRLGNINFKTGIPIMKNTVDNTVTPSTSAIGKSITLNDIKEKDVVCEVYNKLNVLMYYLVVENKIEGEITSILPNKYAPKSIQIDNVNYELGDYAKISKFNSSNGSLTIGDYASVLLGHDGKVVDAYSEDDSNKDYAFVVNCAGVVSTEPTDTGMMYYTVELMHVDGTTETYKIGEDPNQYKWRLVKYSITEESEDEDGIDTVSLTYIPYNPPSSVLINKYDKKIGQSYVSDHIKIFNCVDSTVKLINWNDIPNGTLATGKIEHIETSGDFGDVNIMLTNDILDTKYVNYVVKKIEYPDGGKITKYTYSFISKTNTSTYSSATNYYAGVGTVFKTHILDNSIESLEVKNPDATGQIIQAMDSSRIKMNDVVYKYNSDVEVYIKDYSGDTSLKTIEDIGVNAFYGSINLYFDRPLDNGGKVQVIVLSRT